MYKDAYNAYFVYYYYYCNNVCDMVRNFVAICSNSCENGGSCTSPGVCTCVGGWFGDTCEEGK